MSSWKDWYTGHLAKVQWGRSCHLRNLSRLRDEIIFVNSGGMQGGGPAIVIEQIEDVEHDKRCFYDLCCGKEEPADWQITLLFGEPVMVRGLPRYEKSESFYLHAVCMDDLLVDKRFPFPRR